MALVIGGGGGGKNSGGMQVADGIAEGFTRPNGGGGGGGGGPTITPRPGQFVGTGQAEVATRNRINLVIVKQGLCYHVVDAHAGNKVHECLPSRGAAANAIAGISPSKAKAEPSSAQKKNVRLSL